MTHPFSSKVGLPVLHDAELCLVRMDRHNANMQLGFRNLDGTICNIFFSEILTYRIDNILYQNVVSQIIDSNVSAEYDRSLEKMVRWTSSTGDKLLISEDKLRAHLEKINSGDLRLVYVEPSWGAEIGVIAKTLTVS